MQTIYLAGGCFWGMQKFIDQFEGVVETETGYANGPDSAPTYKDVCSDSGHAETVRVVYDESILDTEKLLDYYFMVIDPLSVNRQGEDSGIQYRTGIYFTDGEDEAVIRTSLDTLQQKVGPVLLAIEACPLVHFYDAEEYHQKYLDKNPAGYCHVPIAKIHWVKTVEPMDFV